VSIYLVEIDGYNPATAAVDTLRYATRAYTSRPTDTPANARYLPRLATALNLEQSMYSQGTTGGASEVGVGAVELVNVDGDLDYLLDWGFAGRAVRVYALESATDALASRTLVFRGTVEQPEFSLERVTFRVRDRLAELDKPVCANRYRGDNDPEATPIGIEGSADIAGQLKPVCLGKCRNVSLVCVCPQKLVYQAHDGQDANSELTSIDQVYDSGVALDGVTLVSASLWDTVSGTWLAVLNQGGTPPITYELVTASGEMSQKLSGYRAGRSYVWTITVESFDGSIQLRNGGVNIGTPITSAGTHTRGFIAFNDSINIYATRTTGTINIGDGGSIVMVPEDHIDPAQLEAADIPPGGYDTCRAKGLIRLGASPAGEVTADVTGTLSNVAELLYYLAWFYGGIDPSDTDNPSILALFAACPQTVGLAIYSDATSIIAAMDAIAASVGAWWTFGPDGLLRVGRLVLPSGDPEAEYNLNSESLESGGFERLATGDEGSGVPCWKVNAAYQRNNTVQTSSLSTDQVFAQSNVAGVVSDDRRAWLNAEYRTASAEDSAVQLIYPGAPEMSVTTCLDVAADAQAEAVRLLALFGTRRDRFRIRVPAAKARGLGLGDVIRVTFPRFGLAAGKLFTIIGRTDVLSGDQDTTDLDIWG